MMLLIDHGDNSNMLKMTSKRERRQPLLLSRLVMMNSMRRLFVFVALMSYAFLWAPILSTAWAQPADDSKADSELPKVNGDQLVSIDFNDVDIVVFIKFISDLTKKNFVIDDRVKGKVTIISPGKITVSEAYQVFLSVLEVHDYTVVPSGQITKIVPAPDARSKNIRTRLRNENGESGDNIITQIIPLRYADPNEVKQLFTPLVSKSSVILSYAPTNTLIITDVQSNIKRLLHMLKAIDRTGVGQQIAIIPVEYADATKLVTVLTTIFSKGPKRRSPSSNEITFVADERSNSIVLLASEGETDNIRQLIKSLDKETPRAQSKIHVYYLEHASAEDMAEVLQDLPQKGSSSSGTSDNSKKGAKKSAPVVSEDVRIAADKATNSLIITADQEDYVVIEDVIKKIDIPRDMVYLEALIMEVNVNKNFQLGTEWLAGGEGTLDENHSTVYGGGFSAGGDSFGGEAGVLGTTLNAAAATTGVALAPGMSLGVFGEEIEVGGIKFPSLSAIIQAYKFDKDIEILSTPQILTTDNQEAKIYVGSNVPFQTTATAATTGTGEVYNSYDYRDVGKTLTITPQISKGRMVRLELALEISSVENADNNRPTTLKRTVETTAIAKDGHTVVLGGLIDDTNGNAEYKTPCLGEIPGLGYLFRRSSKTNDKTNLYIFLTPRVIRTPDEATVVSKEKRKDIERLREENIKLYKSSPLKKETIEQPEGDNLDYRYEGPLPSNGDHDTTPPPAPTENEEPAPTSQLEQTSAAAQSNSTARKAVSPQAGTTSVMEESVDSGNPNDIYVHGQPAAAASTTSQSIAAAPKYSVQVASFPSADQADKVLQQLISKGYEPYTVRTDVGAKTLYRLRIGYYERAEATEELMARLRSDHFDPILIEF